MVKPRLLLGVLLLVALVIGVPARVLADDLQSDQRSVPGKNWYLGAGLQLWPAPSPGLALPLFAAVEWKRLIIAGELTPLGLDLERRGVVALGGQVGLALSDHVNSPYALGGVLWSSWYEGNGDPIVVSRTDVLLTGELGYAFWRSNYSGQLWLGVRGMLPISSRLQVSAPPTLPVVAVVARFML